jgi:hypothetical protein
MHKWSNLELDRFFEFCRIKGDKIVASARSEEMDNVNRTVSSTTGFSTNVSSLPISEKERWVAQILATKFHTEPATESESGVRLNPVMRDLVINEHMDETYKQASEEEVEQTTENRNQS